MSEHYYSSKPSTAHDIHTIEETLRGKRFTFQTDAGVFSKKGIDFGSKLLIDTVTLEPNAKVLDVGCGYGPIGISLATLVPQGHVTMVDINERAIALAKDNAARNRVTHVRVLQSDTLNEVMDETFDAVVTNPPIRAGKEIVHRIFEQASKVLVEGGSLWVVIQKKQGAPSAFAKMETLFSSVEEVDKDKGYRILKATK
ncbi:class I SAM-dependent methyltransferase [Paenibacillus sp. GD4]|uniref:class I SAM-dependent methyltransferase n=1 Tax=Paenibacillus sp. GD4 TaxID=3068890 RepID=UPI002796A858|nr:class I SAM-dependent methyltransferase [Paenibacillus sp. GD4]MDQ1910886.1 class I SAM-dependent methyltransferase [Paenibacillus sp. GD4]